MNWKAEAIEKLEKLEPMRKALQNIPKEIQRLEADANCIRCADLDEPSVICSPNPKGGEKLLNNIAQRQELLWNLQQAQLWVDMVQGALSTLRPDERLVLTKMHIAHEKDCIKQLSIALDIEQASIYRKREKALYRFAQALYGFA